MNPTAEQAVAIRTVPDGKNLKLNAFAGAGKTSTLVLMAEILQPKKGIYLAFNKGIASEAKKKMPKNVIAKTFHSMAFGAMPPWMRLRFDDDEMLIGDFCKEFDLRAIPYRADVQTYYKGDNNRVGIISMPESKIISAYKVKGLIDQSLNTFMSSSDDKPKSEHTMKAIEADLPELKAENSGVFQRLVALITPIIQFLWSDYSSEKGKLAMGQNHQVYFKYWTQSNPVIPYDFVLFDEAQDADPLMLSILKAQECQVIYVGDKHQQIYEWRGAVNALSSIACKELYLTQSFRFGQALANQCEPILKSLGETQFFRGTDAPVHIIDSAIEPISNYGDYDACLCRSNAEVVLTLIELAKNEVPCNTNIATDSITRTLFDMQELRKNTKNIRLDGADVPLYKTSNGKIKAHSWEEFTVYMEDFNSDPEMSITYNMFMNYGVKTVSDALSVAKDPKGITVTTAHKSKGLEWNSIILKDDFLKGFFEFDLNAEGKPIKGELMNKCSMYDQEAYTAAGGSLGDIVPLIRRGSDVEGELRLLYVAITRARKKVNLSLINIVFTDFFKMRSFLIEP